MKVEIRSDDSATIEGYVNVVERESRVIPDRRGYFKEVIAQGAFAKALARAQNIEVKLNHERTLGDTKSKTLELREDQIGLYGKAHISDREVIAAARRNELRGWSFGFFALEQDWKEGSDGIHLRTVYDLDMDEVTIVDSRKTPVYPATSIEMRDDKSAVIEFRAVDEELEIIDHTPLPDQSKNKKYHCKTDPVMTRIKAKLLAN